VADRVAALSAVVARLQSDGIAIEDLSLRRPTLDDVFLRLTGRRPAEEPTGEKETAA
jgi:ABC-2 type transport system ATP-binding protein